MESTLSNRSPCAVTYVWPDSPSHSRSSPSTHAWTVFNERYSCRCPLSSTVFVVTSKLSRPSPSWLFDRYVCRSFLISFEKNFFSSFPDIEGDVNLRNLLSKQITHLHIDVSTENEGDSETVSNLFILILSLCERLIDLQFTDIFSGEFCLTPTVFLLLKNFRSSTLTKLEINLATFVDCLLLLDGRLASLSTLIIKVADIFDPVVDIGHRVSSTNRYSPWWFSSYF